MPSSQAGKLIDKAIRARRLLAFDYRGHPRVVEPHIHGTLTTGHVALSCYQVRGSSSDGELQWKNCWLDEMHGLKMLDERFAGPRPDYKADDKQFVNVFSQL